MPNFNSFSFFATLLTCMLMSASALAHPRGRNATYTVTLESESGRVLQTFHKHGSTFVLGHYGERYNIRVKNQTSKRVEAVVTVDGRDVVSGQVGDYVKERGYIIEPHDSVLIEGFRRSSRQVAAFRFTDPGNSYSSRMGTPQNVGVIGVALFPERSYRRPLHTAKPQPRRHRSRHRDRASRTKKKPSN